MPAVPYVYFARIARQGTSTLPRRQTPGSIRSSSGHGQHVVLGNLESETMTRGHESHRQRRFPSFHKPKIRCLRQMIKDVPRSEACGGEGWTRGYGTIGRLDERPQLRLTVSPERKSMRYRGPAGVDAEEDPECQGDGGAKTAQRGQG